MASDRPLLKLYHYHYRYRYCTYLLTYTIPILTTGACHDDVTVTDYGVLYWPRTTHFHRAAVQCPYGGLSSTAAVATAYRWCNVSDNDVVEWTQAFYDECNTVSSHVLSTPLSK